MTERNWEKDWEMCEKATSEPWGYDYDFLTEPINAYIYMKRGGNCTGPAMARVYKGARERHNDTLFIAEAREALPYWLQRVRELEEDVKVISAANRDLATAVQRIREENRRLKAVAEAAKELIDWLRVDLVESTRAKKVRDALIELEEISNNG